MPIEITMPRLSDTMEEGTLIKWQVKVGDKVKSGDLLADVETDKATMELQSYDDGTVAKLAVDEGQTTPVGQPILILAQPDESIEDAAQSSPDSTGAGPSSGPPQMASAAMPASGSTAIATAPPPTTNSTGGRIRVSPVARKLAEEHGVDLATLQGSGPDGRIIKRDILERIGEAPAATATQRPPVSAPPTPAVVTPMAPPTAQPQPQPPALQPHLVPLTNMRKTIARRLVESKTTIPHFTVTLTIDMDPLLALRQTVNTQLKDLGVKLSVNDFIVRATALALVEHPVLNSSWTDQGIQQHAAVNVGVAIALPPEKGGGLVVATIRDTTSKTLRQIGAETRSLAKKARSQGLNMEEMSDGTFTISNLGMFGVAHFEAIINPPQAAILAVGAAVEKPVARDGQIVIGHEMATTLSGDHRIIDGATAAQFLQTLQQMLENPAVLMV